MKRLILLPLVLALALLGSTAGLAAWQATGTGTGSLTVASGPEAPVVTATGGELQVTVSWTGTADTFAVERSPAGADTWTEVATTASSPYIDTGVDCEASYDYRVIATLNNFTATSNTATATTDTCPATEMYAQRLEIVFGGGGGSQRTASFNVRVEDNLGEPVEDAVLAIDFTIGPGGGTPDTSAIAPTCTTDADGVCSPGSITSLQQNRDVTFAVTGITASELTYRAGSPTSIGALQASPARTETVDADPPAEWDD